MIDLIASDLTATEQKIVDQYLDYTGKMPTYHQDVRDKLQKNLGKKICVMPTRYWQMIVGMTIAFSTETLHFYRNELDPLRVLILEHYIDLTKLHEVKMLDSYHVEISDLPKCGFSYCLSCISVDNIFNAFFPQAKSVVEQIQATVYPGMVVPTISADETRKFIKKTEQFTQAIVKKTKVGNGFFIC